MSCSIVFPSLTIILLIAAFGNISNAAEAILDKGPRTEDLIIRFYGNVEAAYAALKAGDTDIVGYEITPDLYADAVEDPNIILTPVSGQGMYQLDINNNWTMPAYPDTRSPTSYQSFRQAIALLTPKTYFIETCCEGFAYRIDQPIAYLHRNWRNQSYWYEDGTYPYEFNPVLAGAAFDAAGFVQGTTANPDYDAGSLGSAEYLRIHPDAATTMGLLEVCVRTDDARRLEAGRAFCDQLRLAGIPVNQIEGSAAVHYPKVMDNFDYHVYTGGCSTGRFPALSVFRLYHHDNYYLGGANYVTGVDQNGDPNYPELNELLENARYPDNHTEAVSATKKALGYFTEQCITIPLWSSFNYWAYRTTVLGVVNQIGDGLENDYMFMNAYKENGEPLRYALKTGPNELNIVYSQWFYDYQVLNRMNLYSGLNVPPYDLSADQPDFVKTWTVDSWEDDGALKTLTSRTFRNDSYFAELVTGSKKANANANHFFFSAWYMYQVSGSTWSDTYQDLHHIDVVGSHKVDIYFNTSGFWDIYGAAGPILPMDTWLQQPKLTNQTSEVFVEGVNVTTPSYVNLTEAPVWFESVTANGTALAMFVDYNIVLGKLEIFTDLPPGTTLNVTYWHPEDPRGYTPGNLPWEISFEGAGMYYAVDSMGWGFIVLRRNPYYWMETPLLGEVDFHRKPGGCHKIDIFDVVRVAEAYSTQGISVPDDDWFAGADLTSPGGRIDIFDVVTVTSKYGTEWDCNP